MDNIPYVRISSHGKRSDFVNTTVTLVDEDGSEHPIPCHAVSFSLRGGELAEAVIHMDLVEIDVATERFLLQPEDA